MLAFLVVFGIALAASLGVRALDVECVNPPRRRAVKPAKLGGFKLWYLNALAGMR